MEAWEKAPQDDGRKLRRYTRSRRIGPIALFFTVFLVFVLPLAVAVKPLGTVDHYLHSVFVGKVVTNAHVDPTITYNSENLTFGLALGMHFAAAELVVISGLDIETASILYSMVVVTTIALLFVLLCKRVTGGATAPFLASIIFLTVPGISIGLLEFKPQNSGILLTLFLMVLMEHQAQSWKFLGLFPLACVLLAVTHTGLFLADLFFFPTLLFFDELLVAPERRMPGPSKVAVVVSLYGALVAVFAFIPALQGALVTRAQVSIFSVTGVLGSQANSAVQALMEGVLYAGDPAPTIIWVALIMLFIAFGRALSRTGRLLVSRSGGRGLPASMAALPDLLPRYLPRNLIGALVLFGPVHMALAALGTARWARVPSAAKYMLSTALLTTILFWTTSDALLLLKNAILLPFGLGVVGAFGVLALRKPAWPRLRTFFQGHFAWRALVMMGLTLSLIAPAMVGNLYYLPLITSTAPEEDSVSWLGGATAPSSVLSSHVYYLDLESLTGRKYDKFHIEAMDTNQYYSYERQLHYGDPNALAFWQDRFGVDRMYFIYSERTYRNSGFPDGFETAGLYCVYVISDVRVYHV